MSTKISLKEEELEIAEAFERFITHCKSKNLSERTIRYYKANFRRFKEFLNNELSKEFTLISDITPRVMEKFRLYQLEKDISAKSINTYLRGVRVFLNYTMDMNWLSDFKITLVNADTQVKETYTDKELELLLEKPDLDNSTFPEYRNWVIINWLLATGNRAKTVRNIKIGDLDLTDGYVKLRVSKNRKQRVIPLSKSLLEILIEYLKFRDGSKDDYLFCTMHGEKLSAFGLTSALSRYNKRRGVEKTSTHLFRHTFAKLWIKNGGDVFRLQKILGHSSMEMVREYVNMFGEDLKEDFEQFNPLNQFAKQDKSPIKMNK